MARYRKNWNGLTRIYPDPVFIAEALELDVFPVPRRPKITVEPMPRKRGRKNRILKLITGAAFVAMVAAGCTLERPTVAAWVVFGAAAGWLIVFGIANQKR